MKPSSLMSMALLAMAAVTQISFAADSAGCEGGGFQVLGRSGAQNTTVPANMVSTVFRVQGKYVQFDVDAATFGIRNYTLTGAPNALDITGGMATQVFDSKMPDHRGLALTGDVSVSLSSSADIVLTRTGPGLTMKIQAKDCANGGLFQMEVARADETKTLFTHILAQSAFYFDNRNFRDREGDQVPYKDTFIKVASRINFGNDYSMKFVGRDSPQFADRVAEPLCTNNILTRFGTYARVQHCGGVSQWWVASGGRMGQVMGEDATEVAPPATACTHKCQAQNQTRGGSTVLGFPFPVAPADRLQPRMP
ncbi:hypothetical protein SAMN06265795_10984 [Noviherbaspirillum humi]|uniref:Uncharacterized protein n=1 Tax=Noviherbaspirillum humi TaxID=1688639 RepID=A0A239IG94_9BURK|nr:hypothetical protein [Noviherbaspirillum humi]SNS92268.1 hypothetical protein SAMN06265795_10984 [Noviherbaspirillum humi]